VENVTCRRCFGLQQLPRRRPVMFDVNMELSISPPCRRGAPFQRRIALARPSTAPPADEHLYASEQRWPLDKQRRCLLVRLQRGHAATPCNVSDPDTEFQSARPTTSVARMTPARGKLHSTIANNDQQGITYLPCMTIYLLFFKCSQSRPL